MFHVFRKTFMIIFKKFVPNGRADVELVPVTNIIPHSTSTTRGDKKTFKLKYTFDPSHNARSHDDMRIITSAGQRSVISISVLIALQKCVNSPFYCFDEIDADMDSVHCIILNQM